MDEQNNNSPDEPIEEVSAPETPAETGDIPAPETFSDEAVESPYKNGFLRRLDDYYGVTRKKSSIRVEIIAGRATLLVN